VEIGKGTGRWRRGNVVEKGGFARRGVGRRRGGNGGGDEDGNEDEDAAVMAGMDRGERGAGDATGKENAALKSNPRRRRDDVGSGGRSS